MKPANRNPNRSFRVAATMTLTMLTCTMGCSATQPQRDDVAVTHDVQARLAQDAQARPLQIAVATKGGVVYLTGSVPTDSDRNSVERIARDTPGVREVENNVLFGGSPAGSQTISPLESGTSKHPLVPATAPAGTIVQ
jgi:hyperosmotically inducible periplasmic protein